MDYVKYFFQEEKNELFSSCLLVQLKILLKWHGAGWLLAVEQWQKISFSPASMQREISVPWHEGSVVTQDKSSCSHKLVPKNVSVHFWALQAIGSMVDFWFCNFSHLHTRTIRETRQWALIPLGCLWMSHVKAASSVTRTESFQESEQWDSAAELLSLNNTNDHGCAADLSSSKNPGVTLYQRGTAGFGLFSWSERWEHLWILFLQQLSLAPSSTWKYQTPPRQCNIRLFTSFAQSKGRFQPPD